MLFKTRGIVLHSLKMGDSSLIVTVYTEKFGRISCIVHATKGIKAKNKSVLMQPLFLLEMEIYYKKSREVQRIKEVVLTNPYLTVPFDIKKSSQVLFLAEVLCKILREEESNISLFDFIESSLLFFDAMNEGFVNFHIWFLSYLTEFIGIFPHLGDGKTGWFDMKQGVISENLPTHPFYMNTEITECFKKIITLNISDLCKFHLQQKHRNLLLYSLLDYYRIHFETVGNIKSLAVLKEIFE
jgi:DNA repair protein RecO (recombination protein O)